MEGKPLRRKTIDKQEHKSRGEDDRKVEEEPGSSSPEKKEDTALTSELKVESDEKSLVCRETIERSPDQSYLVPSVSRRKEKEPEDAPWKGKDKEDEWKGDGGVNEGFEFLASRLGKIVGAAAPGTPDSREGGAELKSPVSSDVDLESLTGSPKRPGSDYESLTGLRTRGGGSDVESLTGGGRTSRRTGGAGSDAESLTGSGRQRRADSEDSRMDPDLSSSSDTR